MDMEFHNGMSSSGRLYGFGLLWADVAELFARGADELDGADSGNAVDKLARTAALELLKVADELDNSADELVGSAEELVGEREVVVSIIKLICVLCGKDSVNEFMGVNRLSNKSSAKTAENAPKNAMINRIFVCMYFEIGQ